MEKKFIASIYLYHEKAIKSRKDQTVLNNEPAVLARFYSDNGADAIIVYDLSDNDTAHDLAIGQIRQIASESEVPVIGCGNIKRFEDVKKLLYAGCAKAALNYSKEENIAITEEVSKRFGKDRIFACVDSAEEVSGKSELLTEYISGIIAVNDKDFFTEDLLQAIQQEAMLPMIVPMPDTAPGHIAELLRSDKVLGVHGPMVNASIREINSLKSFCAENGVEVDGFDAKIQFSELTLNSDGLIPVVVEDYRTREVLMLAYMNEAAFDNTIKTGRMTYYSRSRRCQWVKGETSGHFQYLKSLHADCDKDTLLAKVSQVGAACHTGNYSCFFNEIVKKEYMDTDPTRVFEQVYGVIMDRKVHPKEGSYTNYLFDKGVDKILKKVGEECTEIVIAAKNPDKEEIKYEIADFLYHVMVLMAEKEVTWDEITRELARR